MKKSADKKSTKNLQDTVPGQKQQDEEECDIPQVHFSPSGKIRLQKLKKSSNFHEKSWKSENSLAALFKPLEGNEMGPGVGEGSRFHGTKTLVPNHTFGRRKSMSLNSIPLALLSTLSPSSSTLSIPGLATHTKKAGVGDLSRSSSTANLQCHASQDSTNMHISSLKSYKSIEMLSGEDFETMASNLQVDTPDGTTQASYSDEIAPDLPTVPKRRSAFLENCMVTDDYLIQQGKRLSGLSLSLDEEKGHPKSFVKRIGIMLKKSRSSTSLSSDAQGRQICTNTPLECSNLLCVQSGPVHQFVVPRRRKISRSSDDLRLATQSCSFVPRPTQEPAHEATRSCSNINVFK